MKPLQKEKDFHSHEDYLEYLSEFERLEQFYSIEGWRNFKNTSQSQMYDPNEAKTYKKWLEYERSFTNMGDTMAIENEIIDRILEKLQEVIKNENKTKNIQK